MFYVDLKNLQPGVPAAKAIEQSCSAFNLQYAGNREVDPTKILSKAEALVGQVLDIYNDFRLLSEHMQDFYRSSSVLPDTVLRTLMFATQRESEHLGALMDKMYPLYEKNTGHVDLIALELARDMRFACVDKPTLWDESGLLKYSPAPFALIHPGVFDREVDALFSAGVAGIEKILADYRLMHRTSQEFMNEKLLERACSFRFDEDDPIRWVLRGKITLEKDAAYRLAHVFDNNLDPEEGSLFSCSLEHFCKLLMKLPRDECDSVMRHVSATVKELVSKQISPTPLPDAFDPRSSLKEFLHRLKPYGFDLPELIKREMGLSADGDTRLIRDLLYGLGGVKSYGWDTRTIWLAAALDDISDERLVAAKLSVNQLNHFYQERGSDCFRQALFATSQGRDTVFAGDLGL